MGDEFDHTDEQDGPEGQANGVKWYKIILYDEDKTEGWVFGEYIKILANEPR